MNTFNCARCFAPFPMYPRRVIHAYLYSGTAEPTQVTSAFLCLPCGDSFMSGFPVGVKEWERKAPRRDPLSVECPVCGAKVDAPCRRQAKGNRIMSGYHPPRGRH